MKRSIWGWLLLVLLALNGCMLMHAAMDEGHAPMGPMMGGVMHGDDEDQGEE